MKCKWRRNIEINLYMFFIFIQKDLFQSISVLLCYLNPLITNSVVGTWILFFMVTILKPCVKDLETGFQSSQRKIKSC